MYHDSEHDHGHGHDCGCDHHHDHGHDHGDGHHHHGSRPRKEGILLAAFGAAVKGSRGGYAAFEAEVRERFPDVHVAWAYTAHKVRKKLAERGYDHDSVGVALSRLHDDGVTHLAVQSLHTVPGVEYHWTRDLAMAYEHPRKGFEQVAMGDPLLATDADLKRACAALDGYIPTEREPGEPVVLVGHGTYHEGHQRYIDYESCVQSRDPHIHVAGLMGRPHLGDVLERLQHMDAKPRRVWLVPFMSVPGHHVRVDILGEHARSWANRLRAAGYEVQGELTGTLEHPAFRALWLEHLDRAVAMLRQEA